MAAPLSDVAIEDYLKVVYSHTEWQTQPITGTQLAARLGLSPSSITEMVKKLAARGLVEHVPYGAITLTEEGRRRALRMVRRHRLIETWLVARFGYGWDEVHDEAEVLEHAVSDRLLDAIAEELGHPSVDPHGDPIPTVDGHVEFPVAVRWDTLTSGSGRIVRISDRVPEVLVRLADRGLRVGSRVEAGESDPQVAGSVWVSTD
jgi:DtxR family Mn-dependent transcriptional regulator